MGEPAGEVLPRELGKVMYRLGWHACANQLAFAGRRPPPTLYRILITIDKHNVA